MRLGLDAAQLLNPAAAHIDSAQAVSGAASTRTARVAAWQCRTIRAAEPTATTNITHSSLCTNSTSVCARCFNVSLMQRGLLQQSTTLRTSMIAATPVFQATSCIPRGSRLLKRVYNHRDELYISSAIDLAELRLLRGRDVYRSGVSFPAGARSLIMVPAKAFHRDGGR
jgi:hypothetical protein